MIWAKHVLLAVVALASLNSGCSGPIWPSRGMTVKLSNPQLTTDQVAELVVVELRKEGFVDIGDPGPEETDGKLITHVFEGPEGIIVSIRLDMVNEVPIRISQNGETFSSSADRLFDTISGKLEARWPGSVVREPK